MRSFSRKTVASSVRWLARSHRRCSCRRLSEPSCPSLTNTAVLVSPSQKTSAPSDSARKRTGTNVRSSRKNGGVSSVLASALTKAAVSPSVRRMFGRVGRNRHDPAVGNRLAIRDLQDACTVFGNHAAKAELCIILQAAAGVAENLLAVCVEKQPSFCLAAPSTAVFPKGLRCRRRRYRRKQTEHTYFRPHPKRRTWICPCSRPIKPSW